MHQTQSTTILNISIPNEQFEQLDNLADITNQSTSALAVEAIECYLYIKTQEIEAIREAVKYADSGEAKFATHEDVCKWLDSWGTDAPLPPPKCR